MMHKVYWVALALWGVTWLTAAAQTPAPQTPTEAPFVQLTATDSIPEGHVAALYGILQDVRVSVNGEAPWYPVKTAIALKPGAEVRTARGKTKIRLVGKGEVRLPPNCHLKLTVTKEGNVMLALKQGKIWNAMAAQEGVNYVVRTPELAAGIRGALFVADVRENEYTRISVFDGELWLQVPPKQPGGQPQNIRVERGKSILTLPDGTTREIPFQNGERQEWDKWDEWKLEIHNELASKFVFGGKQIANLAETHAIDMQRVESHAAEWAAGKKADRVEDQVLALKHAFEKFYKDTNHKPTEAQGFKVLVQNIGNWRGWRGPYINPKEYPPVDLHGSPIRYAILRTPGGKEIPAVVSPGPDRRYSKGKADDLMQYVFYR